MSDKGNTVQTSELVGNEENHDSSEQHDDSHEEEVLLQSCRESYLSEFVYVKYFNYTV